MNPKAIYDIETDGLGGPFVLGAIHYPQDCRTETYRWDREQDMVAALLAVEGEVYAHNGRRYDHLWLLDQIEGTSVDLVMNGQGIIKAKIGKTILRDSIAIFPMSLAKLTGGLKGNLKALCECGKDCGGFCAIHRRQTEAKLKLIEGYCVGDVVELAHALDYFSARAGEWGLTIGATLGSTSWKSAFSELSLPKADLPMRAWELARDGYHGGRCEIFRKESSSGFACDVNSMYPFTLATTPLPVGFERVCYGQDALREWHKGKPGVYSATVKVPETFIPPLPVRVKTGLAFPYGRISGSWPRPELEYAIGSCGCTVENVHSAVAFSGQELIFGPWVERLFALRMKYGKSSREGAWLKWICNSLTGKLGSKNERRSVKLWPDLSTLKVCHCNPPWECECGAYRPMDMECRAWTSTMRMRKLEPCAHAEWAAYLTGAARIKLHKQLTVDESATYCDTDSCWSENERTVDIGSELGQWEPKGRYEGFRALGPKTYHAILDGKEETAAKGIPNPSWLAVAGGKAIPFQSVRGIKRARHGESFFEFIPQHRTVTPNTGRRLSTDSNLTMPIRLDEVSE